MSEIPIGSLMDLAKNELTKTATIFIQSNNFPPALMIYVLDSVKADMATVKSITDAQHMVSQNQKKEEESKNGNPNQAG